jgi:hypothetical protein
MGGFLCAVIDTTVSSQCALMTTIASGSGMVEGNSRKNGFIRS